MLQLYGTSNVYMYTGNGAARTFTMGGDASYTANAWNHTAIVRSSGTMKCYINGYQTTAGTTSYDLSSDVLELSLCFPVACKTA